MAVIPPKCGAESALCWSGAMAITQVLYHSVFKGLLYCTVQTGRELLCEHFFIVLLAGGDFWLNILVVQEAEPAWLAWQHRIWPEQRPVSLLVATPIMCPLIPLVTALTDYHIHPLQLRGRTFLSVCMHLSKSGKRWDETLTSIAALGAASGWHTTFLAEPQLCGWPDLFWDFRCVPV